MLMKIIKFKLMAFEQVNIMDSYGEIEKRFDLGIFFFTLLRSKRFMEIL